MVANALISEAVSRGSALGSNNAIMAYRHMLSARSCTARGPIRSAKPGGKDHLTRAATLAPPPYAEQLPGEVAVDSVGVTEPLGQVVRSHITPVRSA